LFLGFFVVVFFFFFFVLVFVNCFLFVTHSSRGPTNKDQSL